MKTQSSRNDLKKRIVIVDDHPYLREGVARVINQQPDLIVCAEAGSASEGMTAVARHRPDAVIVDISLEEGNGLELIKDLCARDARLPILAFSMHHENLYAERAIHAGARGYVMKREPEDVLLAALRKILGGQIAVSENMVSRLVVSRPRGKARSTNDPADLLSDRELEVFRLFGDGHATREIAAKLHVALSTVQSYRTAIKQKLRLRTGTELVSHAARFVADHPG